MQRIVLAGGGLVREIAGGARTSFVPQCGLAPGFISMDDFLNTSFGAVYREQASMPAVYALG